MTTRTIPTGKYDTIEMYYAHMESDRVIAEEAYFRPRGDDDNETNRRMFRAGFERAYRQLWKPAPQSGDPT